MLSNVVKNLRTAKGVAGLVGTSIFALFVFGLAESISSGFAGFKGGLPFWVIAVVVVAMAVYDFWDQCLRR